MSVEEQVAPITEAAMPMRLSKKQIQSAAMAAEQARKASWKRLVPQAKATWPAVPTEELAKMEGNVHRLAGAVQMRHHLTRQEADQQVQAFFEQQASAG